MTMVSEHFSREELECKCGCGLMNVGQETLNRLEVCRSFYGAMVIHSGSRCEKHNERSGGKPDSAHRYGRAVDVACMASRDRFRLIDAARQAGFRRIGIAKLFVHLDDDPTKDTDVIWLY